MVPVLCVDYHKINQDTKAYCLPISGLEAYVDRIGRLKVVFILDALIRYFQVCEHLGSD